MKNHIILYTILVLLLMAMMHNANAQLEVFDRNPNYLTYNGKVVFLVCSVPNGSNFHVLDFDVSQLDVMKQYGANHIWFMLENFFRTTWTYTNNTPETFWAKMETICKEAYKRDIIVGISVFGYGLVKYPKYYSFMNSCTGQCGYDSGPLTTPYDFYNVNSTTPEVLESRATQQYLMREIVDHTWKYPNVYYNPGWEMNCIWNSNVAQWFRWFVDYMNDYGAQIDPNIKHLYSIERTTDPLEAYSLGADFIVEEDGNAQKVDGIPYVYWSMDGVYRNLSFWNGDDEPTLNWDYTRQGIINGAAGIATIWGTDPEEEDYLMSLSNFASTVENWIDEPGQEIVDSAVPATWDAQGVDIAGSDALDYVDYTSFQISDISATSGSPFAVDYNVSTNTNYYTDRDLGLYFIPPDYQGLVWLKTPNDDKRLTVDPYLSYHINMQATVYVGYDTRVPSKPAWLNGWTSTGEYVVDLTGVEFELFAKDFPAGQVQLGANNGGASSCSMYIILHKPSGDVDVTPPAIPTSVSLTPF